MTTVAPEVVPRLNIRYATGQTDSYSTVSVNKVEGAGPPNAKRGKCDEHFRLRRLQRPFLICAGCWLTRWIVSRKPRLSPATPSLALLHAEPNTLGLALLRAPAPRHQLGRNAALAFANAGGSAEASLVCSARVRLSGRPHTSRHSSASHSWHT